LTPSQHAQHIRELEFKLEKAERGMGMPLDRDLIAWLKVQIAEARKLMDSDGFTEQTGGY
jgi:hypothetical protein